MHPDDVAATEAHWRGLFSDDTSFRTRARRAASIARAKRRPRHPARRLELIDSLPRRDS